MLARGHHRRRELGRTQRLSWIGEDDQVPRVVYIESWIFVAVFGLNGERLSDFQKTFIVTIHITVYPVCGVLFFIYGEPFFQSLAMFLIVAVACHLRILRNRGRVWSRGLQSPVWASRYFI